MVPTSAASDEVDDLHHITAGKKVGSEFLAVAKDGSVVLDNHQAGVKAERAKELRQRAIPRNLPWSAVHRQGDDPARLRSPNHKPKYSG